MSFSFPLGNRQAFFAIVLLVSGVLLASQNSGSAQTVFSQNFSGGTNVSDYVGSGANLFDAISTANSTNLSWSISSGTLQGVRSANSGGAVTRTTDLATSLGAIYRFDINVVDITPSPSMLAQPLPRQLARPPLLMSTAVSASTSLTRPRTRSFFATSAVEQTGQRRLRGQHLYFSSLIIPVPLSPTLRPTIRPRPSLTINGIFG